MASDEQESAIFKSNNGTISFVDSLSVSVNIEPKSIHNLNESPISANNLESTKLNKKLSIFGIFQENLRNSCNENGDSTPDPNSNKSSVNSDEMNEELLSNGCSFPDPIDLKNNLWKENVFKNLQSGNGCSFPDPIDLKNNLWKENVSKNLQSDKTGGFTTNDLLHQRSPRLVTPNLCCHPPNISFYFGSNNKPLVLDGNDSCIRISLSDSSDNSELHNSNRKVNIEESNSHSSPIMICSSPNLLPVASPIIINKKIQEHSTSIGQRPEFSPVNIRSFMSYGPICRICHDDDDKEVLISPCRCSGSVAKVHKSCLERWLSTTSGEGKCELCNYPFTLIRKPKSFIKYLTQREDEEVRRVMLSDLICFSVLTPLILGVSYLCILGALRITDNIEANWAETSFYDIGRRGNISDQIYFARSSYDRVYSKSSLEKILRKKPRTIVSEASGLICLAAILLVIYLTWVIIAAKFQVNAWRKWRSANQEISLANTDRREV